MGNECAAVMKAAVIIREADIYRMIHAEKAINY
jgi:hypothetical protein